ncbi:hypothetical protein BGZ61DRAFT_39667 [Ilyonectria robusta]|jgi:hypothetical protein|uniref:uncharacterized protein n=1 Tax=Ilyonectria robusta TaxID=1079257 RepID=UPI001E8D8D55|nr:uncharacterized protein BGZ61DRAFT_39667 [Ilyonectria robusta]KAH8688169.1 hypothetical protein BGZ61DRAFT_39667 [Ilyonectria robusta]
MLVVAGIPSHADAPIRTRLTMTQRMPSLPRLISVKLPARRSQPRFQTLKPSHTQTHPSSEFGALIIVDNWLNPARGVTLGQQRCSEPSAGWRWPHTPLAIPPQPVRCGLWNFATPRQRLIDSVFTGSRHATHGICNPPRSSEVGKWAPDPCRWAFLVH